MKIGLCNKMNKKIKNILGLTIIEALVATVIVGIGFVAVFQMVNYAIKSIDVSGERTKANFLVSMMAEDVIGYKDTYYGVFDPTVDVIVSDTGEATIDGEVVPHVKKFSDHLSGAAFVAPPCVRTADVDVDDTATLSAAKDGDAEPSDTAGEPGMGIYDLDDSFDPPSAKEEKWMMMFSEHQNLKCRSNEDIRKLKMYKICKWDGVCDEYKDNTVYDDGMYIGRIQINLNNKRKRKVLYFQADYKLRKGQ